MTPKNWMRVLLCAFALLSIFWFFMFVYVVRHYGVGPHVLAVQPTSFDGTVYHFSEEDFGENLAAFIKAHPELRVVSAAPGAPSSRGYWVVVEKKP